MQRRMGFAYRFGVERLGLGRYLVQAMRLDRKQ